MTVKALKFTEDLSINLEEETILADTNYMGADIDEVIRNKLEKSIMHIWGACA